LGDWGLRPTPNPQSPIPNPQSPIPNPQCKNIIYVFLIVNYLKYNLKILIKNK